MRPHADTETIGAVRFAPPDDPGKPYDVACPDAVGLARRSNPARRAPRVQVGEHHHHIVCRSCVTPMSTVLYSVPCLIAFDHTASVGRGGLGLLGSILIVDIRTLRSHPDYSLITITPEGMLCPSNTHPLQSPPPEPLATAVPGRGSGSHPVEGGGVDWWAQPAST